MYVDLDSLELHIGMEQAFGLPTPSQRRWPEVFGFYHFENKTRYWEYHPERDCWRVLSYSKTADCARSQPAHSTSCGELQSLCLLPPPELPRSSDTPVPTQPFVYAGWLFAWVFVPPLQKWHLAKVSRI